MTNLIALDRDRFQVSFDAAAKELKTRAMILAVEVEAVTDPESQEKAVEAQKALADYRKAVETSYAMVKAPILQLIGALDEVKREALATPMEEEERLRVLVGQFQMVHMAAMQSAEAAVNQSLTALEQRREAELAKCTTLEQRAEVHERYHNEVSALRPVQAPPRVEGQVVTEEWEFKILDLCLLARFHPTCVNMEPRKAEIKKRLAKGETLQGIEATKVIKSSVRASKAKELAVSAI